MERVWAGLWGASLPSRQSAAALCARITLCPEAVVILLSAVRQLIHSETPAELSWRNDHATNILQVSFMLCLCVFLANWLDG